MTAEKKCNNKVCHIHKTKGKTAHDRAKGKAARHLQNKAKKAENNRNGTNLKSK